jgi:type VI protein secretion system component VasK
MSLSLVLQHLSQNPDSWQQPCQQAGHYVQQGYQQVSDSWQQYGQQPCHQLGRTVTDGWNNNIHQPCQQGWQNVQDGWNNNIYQPCQQHIVQPCHRVFTDTWTRISSPCHHVLHHCRKVTKIFTRYGAA